MAFLFYSWPKGKNVKFIIKYDANDGFLETILYQLSRFTSLSLQFVKSFCFFILLSI